MAEKRVRSLLHTTRSTPEYLFFNKKECPLSQFYPCWFKIGKKRFSSAEQYFMFVKAKHFGDEQTAALIMKEDDPGKVKQLGRQVTGYDDEEWSRVKYGVALKGNIAKFSKNPMLKVYLDSTRNKYLVNASPTDCEWGIGISVWDRAGDDNRNWRGRNLLGRVLNEVRDQHLYWDGI